MPTTLVLLLAYTTVNLFLLLNKRVETAWLQLFNTVGRYFSAERWNIKYCEKMGSRNGGRGRKFRVARFVLAYALGGIMIVVFTLSTLVLPLYIYGKALVNPQPDAKRDVSSKPIKLMYEWDYNPVRIVKLKTSLPISPDTRDIFYVDSSFNSEVKMFFDLHYDGIIASLGEKVQIIYRPRLKNIQLSEEDARYFFPYRKTNEPITLQSSKMHAILDELEKHATDHQPCLVHYRPYRPHNENYGKYYYFTYFKLNPNSKVVSLMDQIKYFVSHTTTLPVGDEYILYSMAPFESEDRADNGFEYQAEKMMEEVRVRIRKLRQMGIQRAQILALIDKEIALSRLVVTKDYRIFLPDYNNTEIVMPPLPKAVYFLFLKHPEGIVFKQLRDYYQELLDIYKNVGNRVIEENIVQSIRDITDPTKNSINEKCARIREAFLKEFDDTYAKNYYITGMRGLPKKITLPRELMDLQGL